MSTDVLILGAGFGGLEAATSLKRELGDEVSVTVIDRGESFTVGFSKLDLAFGTGRPIGSGAYAELADQGIDFVRAEITRIDPDARQVTADGRELSYDYLLVALGARLDNAAIPGFEAHGHEFYTPEGARALHPVLERFTGGTIVLSIFSKPYKCPPAPYEFAFLLDDFFRGKGIRDRVTIRMLIPAPMPLPIAAGVSAEIEKLLAERDIELLKKHRVTAVDGESRTAVVEGHDAVPFDLFVGVPVHRPPFVVADSPLGDGGWITVDPESLRTRWPDVYAVGDVVHIPVAGFAVPKAGVFAEAGARVVVDDIVGRIRGGAGSSRFEGKGTCFLEFGRGQVAALDANFLGGPEPRIVLRGASEDFRSDKDAFVVERLHRWFGDSN
jgi:sulfide:quinone oxidoreductase